MTFEFHRFRFHFTSAGSIYFPPFKSGNIVRGAFGTIFRKLACVPGCRDAASCDVRPSCPYARVFEPQAARGEGPSGFADWPRPFVFRAAHLDGQTIRTGAAFWFDVHLFDVHDPSLAYFVLSFAQLAREGLGPGRSRAHLDGVDQLGLDGTATARVFDGRSFQVREAAPPLEIELNRPGPEASRVSVRFVTPTELKSGHQVSSQPEFGVLFSRLRDRISTLRALYGPGPLDIDFRAMGDRAVGIRLARCDIRHAEVERVSSRSGQHHPLGGFVGEAEYEGELGPFIPFLEAGRWTGVGRQTVWGKGEIALRLG